MLIIPLVKKYDILEDLHSLIFQNEKDITFESLILNLKSLIYMHHS